MKNRFFTLILLASFSVLLLLISFTVIADATVTVTPSNLNGWVFDHGGIVPVSFTTDTASIGSGSLQFGPIDGAVGANKFIMYAPYLGSATNFSGISYDFYVGSLSASHFYLNIYTDDGNAATTNWYDCRYDFVPAGVLSSWNTFNVTGTTTPTKVTARSGATCPATLGGLATTDTIFRIAINGGQSTSSDAGLIGGFDNIIITTSSGATTYDFEPDIPSVSEATDDLLAYINQLNAEGVINQGQTNALTKKVENALAKFEHGQVASAIEQLNSLIGQANDLALESVLTAEQAQQLIDLTNQLIVSINAS